MFSGSEYREAAAGGGSVQNLQQTVLPQRGHPAAADRAAGQQSPDPGQGSHHPNPEEAAERGSGQSQTSVLFMAAAVPTFY